MRRALALPAILAFAAVVRLAGSDWGLPWALHIDERLFVVAKAIQLEKSLPGMPDPGISSYGILPLWVLVLARKIALPIVTAHVDAVHGSPFAATVLLARWISAGWGVAMVALVAAWGRRFSAGTSLAAAALVAAFPALVQAGHFGTVEAPLVALMVAGLLGAERLAERPGRARLAVCGIVLGLAVSVKAPGAVVVLPALHALWTADRPRFLPRAAALAAIAALVAVALHPGWIVAPASAGEGGEHTTLLGNLRRAYSSDFHDWTLPYAKDLPGITELTKLLPYGIGILPELLGLVGLVAVARRRRGPDTRLLLALVPLLLLLVTARVKTIRFLVPALPMFAVLAAEGTRALLTRRPAAIPGALLALSLVTVAHGAAYVPIWTTTDARVAAGLWLDEHAGPREIVVVEDPPGYGPPIGSPVPSIARPLLLYDVLWRGFYVRHERATAEERRAHIRTMLAKADWLVLSEGHRAEFTASPELRPVESAFYADLDAGRLPFRLVREFRTRPHLGPLVLPDDGAEVLFRTFDHPTIQVWKRVEEEEAGP